VKPPKDAPPAPEGFVLAPPRGPFTSHVGPLYHRPGEGDALEYALLIEPHHTNGYGMLHGGMLSAFFDTLLGRAVMRGQGVRGAVTVQLNVSFLRMARQGEWLRGEAGLVRLTRDLGFAEGRAFVGTSEVGRASGVFKILARKREAS
jgi:uncharacterized protein (TIGR00369 family)